MKKVIGSLVIAKNAVENAVLVRLIWMIIGMVTFYIGMQRFDEDRVKKGFKPKFLAREQQAEPVSKEAFTKLKD